MPAASFSWGIRETVAVNAGFSVAAGLLAYYLMKQYIPLFIQRKLYGQDQCKVDKKPVPEPMGVVAAAVYLIFLFAFIPVPFYEWIQEEFSLYGAQLPQVHRHPFPYIRLMGLLAAITTICTSILLGFADDVLDLRWRHKLLFPTLSSLPLLMVYYISGKFVSRWLGQNYFTLGPLFYMFMVMLVIFCTNAINIIAGINGVEVGQSLVVAVSVALFNVIQIFRLDTHYVWPHCLSLCILLPFIATSLALYKLNKYPARVFVGDTYCYWAGMTLAVVAIIGGFSKTLLLFLIPQVFNFVYSVPQLFHFVPCPRHRLPRFDPETGLLSNSVAQYKKGSLGFIGRAIVEVFVALGILSRRDFEKDGEP
ncbi:Protein Y60A3A.14 [Aphelenchoides avenae]|nr:Protein Y60A3A.14 [Aphelenchus avenae]